MRLRNALLVACGFLGVLAGRPLLAAEAGSTVDLWVRAPGRYGAGADPARKGVLRLDLSRLSQVDQARLDVQYGSERRYRGVPLKGLIDRFGPPGNVDTALLRFHNGVIIPLPFRDAAWMGRLAPLVALGKDFAPIAKQGDFLDARPITFQGNKLVVSDRGHPAVPERHRAEFNPYAYADSLSGVEFVDGAAYALQFDPAPEGRAGAELFRQSCQFCHGVRRAGASFGWDFVEPVAIHSYRHTEQKLHYHIRYRSADRGLLMPALKHISEEDAGRLLSWLRAVAQRPMPAYSPR